jgi:hypothetical protein
MLGLWRHGSTPGEPARDPLHQLLELSLPLAGIHAEPSGTTGFS